MKQAHEVIILNQRFVLKTDHDQAHVQKIADYVNRIFQDIQERARNISTQNVAILGALNIAEKLLLNDEESKEMVSQWKSRLEALITDAADVTQ